MLRLCVSRAHTLTRITTISQKAPTHAAQRTRGMATQLEQVRIIVVGPRTGEDSFSELRSLPSNATIVAHGATLEELREAGDDALASANVVLNSVTTRGMMTDVLALAPNVRFVQSHFAGVEHLLVPELVNSDIQVSNAKGLYASPLAEFALMGCSYFAKDLPRLLRQKGEKKWEKYYVEDLRDKTMGIIGYGGIGRACGVLAKGYGMRVLAQRRHPERCEGDSVPDEVFGANQIEEVMAQSDYIVAAVPLAPDTLKLIGRKEFAAAKEGSVFINVGRGAVVDEEALVEALQTRLKGAALDVFAVEPLPQSSPLWTMDNVLISPHSADMTPGFLHKAVRLFVENVNRLLRGEELLNLVDKQLGY